MGLTRPAKAAEDSRAARRKASVFFMFLLLCVGWCWFVGGFGFVSADHRHPLGREETDCPGRCFHERTPSTDRLPPSVFCH
jgi:hypothetical protein